MTLYESFETIHNAIFEKLQTDTRLTSIYELDSWNYGMFNLDALPTQGMHGRYQKVAFRMIDECTGYYTYEILVSIWICVAENDIDVQYEMMDNYLGKITELMTDKKDDWSLEGEVLDIALISGSYHNFFTNASNPVLLGSAEFSIKVDIPHEFA